MFNIIEMSDLWQFQKSMPEGREKELLHKVLFEYGQYEKCGTIEECEQRKEWMSYSIDDIRAKFVTMARGFQEEVDMIRKDEAGSKKRKRAKRQKPVRLIDAPVGLFLYDDELCMKTEYMENGHVEAYIVSSGEILTGGVYTAEERNNLIVIPVEVHV